MKFATTVFLILILVVSGQAVAASENDLSTAIFLTHFPQNYAYSSDNNWFERYESEFRIDSEQECNPMVPDGVYNASSNPVIWYVVVTFHGCGEKVWSLTKFGLNDYDPDAFVITGGGICLEEGLEIPSSNWPGPNQGIELAGLSSHWRGKIEPVYYFEGYQYIGTTQVGISGYYDSVYHDVELRTYPLPSGVYKIAEPNRLGSMGIGMPGETPHVYECERYACCLPTEMCELLDQWQCEYARGVFHADLTSCDGLDCHVYAPCCIGDSSCVIIDRFDCEEEGGYWYYNDDECTDSCLDEAVCCTESECIILPELECEYRAGTWYESENHCTGSSCGACCYVDPLVGYACLMTSWGNCSAMYGGEWYNDITRCDYELDFPCQYQAAEKRSWGRIKTMYQKH
jgi:hypothetical protein